MTDEPHPVLKAITNALKDEVHSRGWTFWHLEETAEITEDGYNVTPTRNLGAPNAVQESWEFPESARPETIARMICDSLEKKVK